MRWSVQSVSLAAASLSILGAISDRPAAAAPKDPAIAAAATAPGAFGGPSVAVKLDAGGKRLHLRACAGPGACVAGPADPSIAVELGDVDAATSRVDALPLPGGRSVVHAVVRSAKRPDQTFEAIVVGRPGDKTPTVVFAGVAVDPTKGGTDGVRIVRDEGTLFVAQIRKELTLCGQKEPALLAPRRLDPKSLELRAVAMHRLPRAVRDAAKVVEAVEAKGPPIASVLSARGASSNDGGSLSASDGDEATAWTEGRKGDGKGEFVVFAAPSSVPLEKISIVVRPTKAVEGFAQPVSVFLSLDEFTYRVVIPVSTKPGARFDVPLPAPTKTGCVAVSLDLAESQGDPAVGFAEVEGVPVLPGSVKSLEDLVGLLDAPGPSRELAATVLTHGGAPAARAIDARLPSMGEAGKALAVDLLEAAPCAVASKPLARLSWDAPRKTAAEARLKLDGCGREATPAIADAFTAGPDSAREALAERYAKLDPKAALPAILALVPTASAARRHTYRGALARVAGSSVGREAISAWLASTATGALPVGDTPDPVIELGRAVAPLDDAASLAAPLSAALLRHAAKDRPFAARFLAAAPLASLAARGDTGALAWLRALLVDPDRNLRARAAEVAAEVDGLRPELVKAVSDKEPRVRAAAVLALDRRGAAGVTGVILPLLAHDGWTFVRVAAADALGNLKGAADDVDAGLAEATRDPARSVRAAAVRGLGRRGARSQWAALRSRAFDDGESIDVRVEAIEALGATCDRASADALLDLAKKANQGDGARQLGLAAIMALGAIHPPDLDARLDAIDGGSLVVKDAIARARKTPATCK